MTDPVTEACRRVREQIVQRFGGFDGYFDQLQELDRKRLAAEATKKKKSARNLRPAPKKRVPKRPA